MEQTPLLMRYPQMTRDERKQQIQAIICGATTPITLSQIARLAGIKKSPYLGAIVNEIERTGAICREEGYLTNGLPVWLFSGAR